MDVLAGAFTQCWEKRMSLPAQLSRLDPRTLILLAVLFGVVTVLIQDLSILLALLCFSLFLCVLFQVRARDHLARFLAVDGFVLITVITLPFTMQGTEHLDFLGLSLSKEGLVLAAKILLKANAVFLCFIALLGRMQLPQFAHGLAHLWVPMVFVQILLMMIRYIDVLGQELGQLRRAMKCRGFALKTNWHTFNSLGQLVGMVFVRAVDRSEHIQNAMKCRGFQGTFPLLSHFHYSWFDGVFGLLFLSVLGVLIFGWVL